MANPDNQNSRVTVKFAGLMLVYRDGKHYEIGVLKPNIAKDHEFTVTVEPEDQKDVQKYLRMGNKWIFEVVSDSGRPTTSGITHAGRGPEHRRDTDTEAGKEAFDWIMDFEGSEFHNQPLDLIPGCLTPIMHFDKGRLFTKHKSSKLRRNRGVGSPFTDFGFIAETSALEIQLGEEDILVLRVANKGEEGTIFSLPYQRGKDYEVYIQNIPKLQGPSDPHGNHSHFRFYYDAFRGVDEKEQFDFELVVPEVLSLNPYLRERAKESIGSMPCGKLLLSKRNKPLE